MPAKKDPNKPRGRTSGYAYFVQTCREEHKRKHPNEQIVFTEFSKKCAKRWKVRYAYLFVVVLHFLQIAKSTSNRILLINYSTADAA